MGWWTGRSTFFLFQMSKTTWYFFISVLGPLYRGFCTSLNQKSLYLRNFFQEFLKFLENYSIFFVIAFSPLRRVLRTSFGKKIGNFCNKKNSQLFFEKKHVFEKMSFSGISQNPLNISSWPVFVPLWRVMKTYYGKIWKKMNRKFFQQKNSTFFEKKLLKKTSFSRMSQKLLNIFSWLFVVPLEEVWRHLLRNSKINRKFFQYKFRNFFSKNGFEKTSFSEIYRKLLNIFSW